MIKTVSRAYKKVTGNIGTFTLIHLVVGLIVGAVIVPLTGFLLTLSIATSEQAALTDQDIALFLISPVGVVASLVIVSLLIVANVLEIAVFTVALYQNEKSALRILISGLSLIMARLKVLLAFAALLTIRVVLISAPFLLLSGGVYLLKLSSYDINYYLTHTPPEFITAVILIGGILLVLVVVLGTRLAAWSIALHLLLFENISARNAFGQSAERTKGYRSRILGQVAIWLLFRTILVIVLAVAIGFLIQQSQNAFSADLRGVVVSTVALGLVWGALQIVLTAWANGALAELFFGLYRDRRQGEPDNQITDPPSDQRLSAKSLIAIFGLVVLVFSGGLYLGNNLIEQIDETGPVEIIAHRGASVQRPENTMAAIEKALEDQADWVEIDVQETADGEVIVAHDSDFMKLAGVDLKVWDATMDDIAEIDIGSWFDPAYASERTPTLREVLLTARGRAKVLIELKYYGYDQELEARVANLVEETDMTDEIAVMSLSIPGIQKMHALRPDWPYGILAATAIGDLTGLDADFLAVSTGQVSLDLIHRAHENGQKIYVWTVDDPIKMSRMITMGVDGLITNLPALARTVVEEHNALSDTERLLLWLSDQLKFSDIRPKAD